MSDGRSEHPDMAMPPRRHFPLPDPPWMRAPEAVSTIYRVTLAAAGMPLTAGIVLMGWRAAHVAAIAVGSCVVVEKVYYRVTRQPVMLGSSHAVLTGMLLALTLPAFVPWYVPLMGAVFGIILGKAIFNLK